MSVTVTKTGMAATSSERWTNFRSDFLANWDSYLAICALRPDDSQKWGTVFDFRFSIPPDATIISHSVSAHWWGSNAGSYIWLTLEGVGRAYDTGAASGRWITCSGPTSLTPAQINDSNHVAMVEIGRTTGAAVNVYIDQLTVSVTYEPYVAPPPPPPTYAPTVTTQAPSGILSNSATGNGTIVSDGGGGVTDHGFTIGTSPGAGGPNSIGAGAVGAFSLSLAGLAPGTVYYVTAYAGNAGGYGYGAAVAFTTATQKAGDGGAGLVSSISGQSAGYAGGGGGGMYYVGAGGGATHGGGLGRAEFLGQGNPGVVNTGGGGGGSGRAEAGGAGGRGVVVIRYKTADAVSTSPSLSKSIFRPSLAYRGGQLFAPYSKGEDAKILTIASNSVAAETVLSTTFLSANVIPQMTSATAPSGVVTSSGDLDSPSTQYAKWQAFDHKNPGAAGWMAPAGATGWLQYRFPAARIITSYAVTSRGDEQLYVFAPAAWTFEGSNDGTTWTTLDTRTTIHDWAGVGNVRKFFDLTNTTAYAYYRLNITASTGSHVGVGELEMMETMTTQMHGILADTAQVVVIAESNSTPSIDGSHIATRIDDTHFSIPVNVTAAGTRGMVLYNHSVGWALTPGGYNDVGWLTQSPTTFHTGSMKKDFRYVSVSHDVLPDGAAVRPMSWLIDGVYGTASGVAYSPQETRFPINKQGYSIETTMGMTPDYTKSVSPIVRGVVVIWDFIKTPKHTYNLDCRKGAGNGKWKESPEAAIAALFQAADTRSTFEDRFNGAYTGIMDGIEFKQAARSLKEGPSGLVKITVREVE